MLELIIFTLAFFCVIFWLASFIIGIAALVLAIPGIAVGAGLYYAGMPWWVYVPAGLLVLGWMAERWEAHKKKRPD